ncbi:hypothetical protein ACLOJK_036468 [Asimina triloba]
MSGSFQSNKCSDNSSSVRPRNSKSPSRHGANPFVIETVCVSSSRNVNVSHNHPPSSDDIPHLTELSSLAASPSVFHLTAVLTSRIASTSSCCPPFALASPYLHSRLPIFPPSSAPASIPLPPISVRARISLPALPSLSPISYLTTPSPSSLLLRLRVPSHSLPSPSLQSRVPPCSPIFIRSPSRLPLLSSSARHLACRSPPVSPFGSGSNSAYGDSIAAQFTTSFTLQGRQLDERCGYRYFQQENIISLFLPLLSGGKGRKPFPYLSWINPLEERRILAKEKKVSQDSVSAPLVHPFELVDLELQAFDANLSRY